MVPHAANDCGSFWWRDVMKCPALFRGIAVRHLGDGRSILFWKDFWDGNILCGKYPRLYSFAKNQDMSGMDFLQGNDTYVQLNLPLSDEVLQEYTALQNMLGEVHIQQQEPDHWSYIWGNDKYTSSKFYNHQFSEVQSPAEFSWIWKSKCVMQLKVFAWLLMVDRLNT